MLVLTTIFIFCLASFSSGNVIHKPNQEIDNLHKKTPYATQNTCGGHLEAILDETIVLEYKPDEEYDNDELCVWEVRINGFLGALFTKTKSGFEIGHDYLQVSAFSDNIGNTPFAEILGNTTGLEQANAQGSIIFVIFTSDYSNTGTGFRMEITGYRTSPFKDRVYDDFMTSESAGSVTLRPYVHDMTQSYLILPKHTTVPSLVLEVDYVTEWFDYIYVYTMERNGQVINFKQQARRLSEIGSESFEAVYYANFIVLFYSNANNIPENGGFTLNWYVPENSTTNNYS